MGDIGRDKVGVNLQMRFRDGTTRGDVKLNFAAPARCALFTSSLNRTVQTEDFSSASGKVKIFVWERLCFVLQVAWKLET